MLAHWAFILLVTVVVVLYGPDRSLPSAGRTVQLVTPAAVLPAEAGHRVLIVDDNIDAAQTLVMVLEELGYEARSATDARSALALLDSFVPEVAVLDIGLPGMDGYELARRLRADARTASIRLMALTGYGSEADRQRALQAGFDEHLIKPVSIESLLSALNRWLGSTALNA